MSLADIWERSAHRGKTLGQKKCEAWRLPAASYPSLAAPGDLRTEASFFSGPEEAGVRPLGLIFSAEIILY